MKYCQRCGMQNDDSSVFCSKCGNSLAANYGTANPTVVVVGNTNQQAPAGSNPGTLWLILNIVVVCVSCCTSFIPSIIGIIFAGISMSNFNKGMYSEAKSHANVAKWMFWVSLILIVLGFVISLVAGLIPVIIGLITTATQTGSFIS